MVTRTSTLTLLPIHKAILQGVQDLTEWRPVPYWHWVSGLRLVYDPEDVEAAMQALSRHGLILIGGHGARVHSVAITEQGQDVIGFKPAPVEF